MAKRLFLKRSGRVHGNPVKTFHFRSERADMVAWAFQANVLSLMLAVAG